MRPYHAMLIQETNLRESRAMYAFCAYAERFHKMLVLSSPIPRDAPVGTRGGTAIIIPVESIEKESKNETDREACARVRARHEQTADGRLAMVVTKIAGHVIHLVSMYAPVHAAERKRFLAEDVMPHIAANSLIGTDANCVPDARLDQVNDSDLPSANVGAAELVELMAWWGLTDVAREQLGLRDRDRGSAVPSAQKAFQIPVP